MQFFASELKPEKKYISFHIACFKPDTCDKSKGIRDHGDH